MIKKYRKKPVVIEAVQYTGDNMKELYEFAGMDITPSVDGVIIHTLEGDHLGSVGDYIIKGIAGEFYPCKPEIFRKTYDEVDNV